MDRWRRDFALSNPLFAPLTPYLEALAGPDWPTQDILNELAELAGARTSLGMPIRFAAIEGKCKSYERSIAETGVIPTRPQSWHDFFNAMAWIMWPRSKAMLNALHLEEIDRAASNQRGRSRDALTLMDESGVLVACANPELWELLRGRQWTRLFWERREEVERSMRFTVFGHALFEKLLTPWPGITGKCLLLADADMCDDGLAASQAQNGTSLTPAQLLPLPVLGIPGSWPSNSVSSFYADSRYFR
jgi:Protein of unknown function (DUF3025)